MNLPEKNIINFLKTQHLASIAMITKNNLPYCSNAFYAFNEELMSIFIAGEKKTFHISNMKKNSQISGTIALNTLVVAKIEGIQFMGQFQEAKDEGKEIYLKKFPYAIAFNPQIWQVDLKWIKYTNNTLGFGKKIIWER